ncbi:MAG: TetR family transcriptional regulator [Deferrisomatales bacterium]|nr:TetR family transcriptional regulator [Deferrisomatales bacterium]
MTTKGEKTRQEIVGAALQLFSRRGYSSTSVADVLAATGITKGGLYGHFRSKEDLWHAAYARTVHVWRALVFRGVREIADPLERIARTVENDLRDYIGGEALGGRCFFFSMLVELAGQPGPMCDRILSGFRAFSGLLQSWLEEADRGGVLRPGIDHREVADFLVTSINGAAALYAAGRDPRLLEDTIRQVRLHLEALRPAPGPSPG